MAEEIAFFTHHPDHAFDHRFGSLEIGNHAILERTDGFDIFMGLFVHLHRAVTDRDGVSGAPVYGNNRRLIHDHLVVHHDKGIGGAQVN